MLDGFKDADDASKFVPLVQIDGMVAMGVQDVVRGSQILI
jgi:hypothetical protein